MFKEISDKLWERIEPILEPFKRTFPGGSKPIPFRNIMNGIFYLLKTGCQWNMIPRCYGSKSTIHERFQFWVERGVFDKIFQLNLEEYEELKGIGWEWQSIDGSQIQAPVRGKKKSSSSEEKLGPNPTDRGRAGTKIHIIVDQKGIPLGIETAGANVHDSRLVGSTIETIPVEPKDKLQGLPNLCMDKGYSYKRVELEVEQYGYNHHIRRIGEEKFTATGEKTHPARRWVVERTFAWLKGFRSLRTRYTRKGENFLALLKFACGIIVFQAI